MQDAPNEVELTPRRLLSIFWLFLWRGLAGAVALGASIGFVLGLGIALAIGRHELWAPTFIGSISAAAGFVWQVYAMRMALRKRYKDFRIVLIGL